MNTDQITSILAMIALVELMVTIGLGARVADVLAAARDWRMVCRGLLANYVLVPAVAIGLLLAFHAHPMIAAGFLVAAACPGAPYGPPLTAMAKGDTAMSVGLMVILAGSSAIIAPLLLQALLPIVAGSEPLRVNGAKMVMTLALSQFLPLCVGLYVRQRNPGLASRLRKPAARLSAVLNVLLIVTILAVQFQTLAAIRLRGHVGMLTLLAATATIGWVLGGRAIDRRKSMTITTAVRNVGVGLVIATGSFPGTAAVTATTAYALVQTIIMALVALAWGRWTAREQTMLTRPPSAPTSSAV